MKLVKRLKSLFRIKNNQKGFTLLEVLISLVILSVIITPILAVFTSAFSTTVVSQNLLDGAYIAQDVYEGMVAQSYSELLATSDALTPYDSDGDGVNDCYIKKVAYPDGVFSDLTSTEIPSYVHINIVGDEVIIFGQSGTDDTANSGTQITSIGNITLNNSSTSKTVTVQVGTNSAMTFEKKYDACPLVVIVNIYLKQVNTQTVSLTVTGCTSDVAVVEYARKSNYEEFTSSLLSSANIYYGVNDHTTTLVHASVQVYDIDDSTNRIGYVEGTFEVSLT